MAARAERPLWLRILRATGLTLLLVCVGLALFLWWAAGGEDDTRPIAPGEIYAIPGAQPALERPPEQLRVMTFNIAYGRGPAGDDSGPWSEAHVRDHLDRVAARIAGADVDVAALQEVDLGAARSHHIHQGRYLAGKLGMHASCVVTWQNRYVPFPYWPPARHYGAMRSGQCVLSRWPITEATRYRLPQPSSHAWWYNAFYLHRAIQRVRVEVAPGAALSVYNVHLEAFDLPNRVAQAERLAALIAGDETSRAVVLGDLNAPPPEAPKRDGFVDEPEASFVGDTTIAAVTTVEGVRPALPGRDHFTFPAEAPTRRLDHVFVRGALDVLEAEVLTDDPASDHLPVITHLGWR